MAGLLFVLLVILLAFSLGLTFSHFFLLLLLLILIVVVATALP